MQTGQLPVHCTSWEYTLEATLVVKGVVCDSPPRYVAALTAAALGEKGDLSQGRQAAKVSSP